MPAVRSVLVLSVLVSSAVVGVFALPASSAQLVRQVAESASCDRLRGLTIPDVRIESASIVPAGPMTVGARSERDSAAGPTLPEHCRVAAVATPTTDSRIGIEIWIPVTGWNGKLLGTGNGGFSSALSYSAMAEGLTRGYAVAGTDTGHTGDSMDFGNGHPEKIVDWAHRAVHVMTEVAKLVVRNHEGRFPARAYFTGCSTGGQQGLSEAQRYPGDYDGIIAGDPGNNRLRLIYGFLWTWLATHDEHGQPILPSAKLPALASAVMTACDARDGLKDGLIADPGACRFDPVRLACRGAEHDGCLTKLQVEAVRKVYAGPRHPRTGAPIFSGWARGSELGWRGYITDAKEPVRVGLFTGWAFHDPTWDPRSFDWDRDIAFIDQTLSFLDATSTDLSAFKARRGKLLMYTGLADPVVPPQDTIDYYERVATAGGGLAAIRTFFRFFPVPGMGHCGGGTGPNRFNMLSELEAWVEHGAPPRSVTAVKEENGRVVLSRVLCAWPDRAALRGRSTSGHERGSTCSPRPATWGGRAPR